MQDQAETAGDPLSMPPTPDRKPLLSLDRDTLVPIGLLVTVVLSAITATVWINTTMLELQHGVDKANTHIQSLDLRVTDVQAQMAGANSQTWTWADMRHWVELVNASNPASKLPTPIK